MALVTNSSEKIVVNPKTIEDNNHVNQVQNQTKTKTYSLDIDKVLQNKLETAKRTDISYKMTSGGLTVTLDLATFELFIAAISSYYQCYPLSAGEITFQSEHDRRGVLVQKTFKVQLKSSQSYTINAYTIKATLLINGKSITHFIENELPTIHGMICNTYVNNQQMNTSTINKLLEDQLQYILDNRSTNNNMKARCRKCNRNVITRAVQCNIAKCGCTIGVKVLGRLILTKLKVITIRHTHVHPVQIQLALLLKTFVQVHHSKPILVKLTT